MNENFNFNKTPTTAKPSAQRSNTLFLFTVLLVLILAYWHLHKNGMHVEMDIPSNKGTITQDIIPQESVQNTTTTETIEISKNQIMDNIYYYGKIIIITAVVMGLLYLWYKYDTSVDATITNKEKGVLLVLLLIYKWILHHNLHLKKVWALQKRL